MGKQHKAKAAKKGGSSTVAAAAAAAAAPEAQERHKGKGKARRSKKDVHHYGGDDLERELAAVGLRIKQIEADGNCFFRSVLDQLEGDGGDHLRLRQRVMEYVEEREDDYKFFMCEEDDEPFDKYIKRMKKEGAWAGHLELQATSLLLERNICIYQSGQPVWRISNFAKAPEEETLHLSYHDGMHYNSVRNADDYGSGPPEPVRMRSAGAQPSTAAAAAAGEPAFGAAEVDQVVAGTGCFDRERIRRMLEECGGSVEQAIELLIEQLGQEEPDDAADGAGGSDVAEGTQQQAAAQRDVQLHAAAGSDVPQAGGSAGSAAERSQQAAQAAVAAGQQQQQQLGDDSIRLELQLLPGDSSCIRVIISPAEAGGDQQQQQAADTAAGDAVVGEADSGDKRGGKRASKGVRVKHKPEHAGRNQRCPCGSGKKVKNCCGALRGKRGAAAIGRSAAADEGSSDAAVAAVQLQVLHI